jgi:hypothetical protein
MIKKITLTTLLVISMLFVFAVSKQKVAVDYLSKNQKELNISSQDIKDLIVLTDYYDEFSNVNRVWFQQTAYGLPLLFCAGSSRYELKAPSLLCC